MHSGSRVDPRPLGSERLRVPFLPFRRYRQAFPIDREGRLPPGDAPGSSGWNSSHRRSRHPRNTPSPQRISMDRGDFSPSRGRPSLTRLLPMVRKAQAPRRRVHFPGGQGPGQEDSLTPGGRGTCRQTNSSTRSFTEIASSRRTASTISERRNTSTALSASRWNFSSAFAHDIGRVWNPS